jgi:hypothetical protein
MVSWRQHHQGRRPQRRLGTPRANSSRVMRLAYVDQSLSVEILGVSQSQGFKEFGGGPSLVWSDSYRQTAIVAAGFSQGRTIVIADELAFPTSAQLCSPARTFRTDFNAPHGYRSALGEV